MDATPERGITEVGLGNINFKPLLAHTEQIGIEHCFVAQDYTTGPALESPAISYKYLNALT